MVMLSPRGGAYQRKLTPPREAIKASSLDVDEDKLFSCPTELVCPLTLAPFIDPVLTTAGHVYERAAIAAHMERSSTDPLTRQPLLNKSLTPVYVLRSRALEYRETAARACIARVCSGCPDPMRYLRRAVELIADTGSHVQGLSQETVDYVLAHPSNAFDSLALQLFAQGLFQSGYKDRAATLWASLLLDSPDRAQQAELLRRCLSCWTDHPGEAGAGGDDYVFQKLAALFEGRASWEQLVELAQHAELGDPFVLRLCEQLLFRPLPALLPDKAEDLPSLSSSQQEKRLLLKYVHVLTGSLQKRQSEVESRLQELARWQRRRGSSIAQKSGGSCADDSSLQGAGLHLPGWVRHPAVIVCCMFVTAALPPDHPAGRALRAAPFLALLPASSDQE